MDQTTREAVYGGTRMTARQARRYRKKGMPPALTRQCAYAESLAVQRKRRAVAKALLAARGDAA